MQHKWIRRLLVTTAVLSFLLGPPLFVAALILAWQWPGSWLTAFMYLGGAIGAWIAFLASLAEIFGRRLLQWPFPEKETPCSEPSPPHLPFYLEDQPQFGGLLRFELAEKGWAPNEASTVP